MEAPGHFHIGDVKTFDEWIHKFENKSPPVSELQALSRRLVGVAEPTAKKAKLSRARSVSLLKANSSFDCGISIAFMEEHLLPMPECQAMLKFQCPMWFFRNYGIIEILRKLGADSGSLLENLSLFRDSSRDFAKKPNVFISYTGSYSLSYFTEVLVNRLDPDCSAWIDVFCVDQFMWNKEAKPELEAFKDDFLFYLKESVQKISRTLLVVDKWDNLEPLTKIWVIWELYATVEGKAMLDVVLNAEEEARFIVEGLFTQEGFGRISKSLATVDAWSATAFHEKDTSRILNAIKKEGAFQINQKVISLMNTWFAKAGRNALQTVEKEGRPLLAHNLSVLLDDLGHGEEAEKLSREAIEGLSTTHEKDSIQALLAMKQHAMVLAGLGRESECLPIACRVIKGFEDHYGKRDLETVACLVDFAAGLPESYESLINSVPSMDKVAEELKAMLEEGNVKAAYAASNLAMLFERRGLADDAVELYRASKQMFHDELGSSHPETLAILSNLANLLDGTGEHEMAELEHRAAVRGMVERLGQSHPNSLAAMTNLASTLSSLGRVDEAESLLNQVIELAQTRLGPNHGMTLQALRSLAAILEDRGELQQAATLYKTALTGQIATLGTNHDTVCFTRVSLLLVHSQQKRWNETAKANLRDALIAPSEILQEATLEGMTILAAQLAEIDEFEDAEQVFRKVLQFRLEKEGDSELNAILWLKHSLGRALAEQGKLAEAERMLEEVLGERTNVVGQHHCDTMETALCLADLFSDHEKLENAISLYRRVLDSNDDTTRLRCLYNFSLCLSKRDETVGDAVKTCEQLITELPNTHPMFETASDFLKELQCMVQRGSSLAGSIDLTDTTQASRDGL